eukprot:CAMPEP_0206510496 /NCGR_PEP_ID=MMETSP0324_2-20121206/59691_1 /ASSEMBLY_ACC=CAM_ASM_000836 /TAXON_ID=2866 /ORGANISM="Crypthecodinium cohnii, Strain Seligo" /LENGTH=58 /DNA_ID=CAMNT_0054002019 /DNA_START=10 /DNA_END=183 /DNA_ORIENTATION=-
MEQKQPLPQLLQVAAKKIQGKGNQHKPEADELHHDKLPKGLHKMLPRIAPSQSHHPNC